MGAAIWFVFMLFILLGAIFYAKGGKKGRQKMSAYDVAHFEYRRINIGLGVASLIGVFAIPVCVHFFV